MSYLFKKKRKKKCILIIFGSVVLQIKLIGMLSIKEKCLFWVFFQNKCLVKHCTYDVQVASVEIRVFCNKNVYTLCIRFMKH